MAFEFVQTDCVPARCLVPSKRFRHILGVESILQGFQQSQILSRDDVHHLAVATTDADPRTLEHNAVECGWGIRVSGAVKAVR